MEVNAKLKYARISPQKARLVADQVRGLSVDKALEVLTFSQKKSAAIIKKILDSAIAKLSDKVAHVTQARVTKRDIKLMDKKYEAFRKEYEKTVTKKDKAKDKKLLSKLVADQFNRQKKPNLKAMKELKKLQSLNDGKEYCMTRSFSGDWRVGEKTAQQKAVDAQNPKLANKKVTNFVKDYDLAEDYKMRGKLAGGK